MDNETKQQLIPAGRSDLVEIFEINQSGWAGIMPDSGNIVDRRKFPFAIPLLKNESMGIPKSKELPANAAWHYRIDEHEVFLFNKEYKWVKTEFQQKATDSSARYLLLSYNREITNKI